jgi:hypothetical protein
MPTEDDDALDPDALEWATDEARAAAAEAIAKAKADISQWVNHALSLIEQCYSDTEAAREIWNDAFEEAVRIAGEAGP